MITICGIPSASSTTTSTSTATYDAEGRVQTITGLTSGTIRYYYDGSGNRVMKVPAYAIGALACQEGFCGQRGFIVASVQVVVLLVRTKRRTLVV